MDSWHSYGKIYNLGHAALAELFNEPVLVEEKIDGSQFSFGVFDGVVRCKSKGAELNIHEPEKMFKLGVEWVVANASKLAPGVTYRGEYLNKPKHNALAYDRVPRNNIMIFDIAIGHEKYVGYEDKAAEATRIGLEVVPQFVVATPSAGAIGELLECISCLGGQKVEGLVIKNYARYGRDGKTLMGKYVSESFREVHKQNWKDENPTGKDILGLLGEVYRTPARWNKAMQHLAERGVLTNDVKDIGPLIRETQTDVAAECKEEIKEKLYAWAAPHIKRAVIRGLPEYYKKLLLERQFVDGED